jgi:hypothetical protein
MFGGAGMAGELLTDASSWRVLHCYLGAAAWIGVPPAWPPAARVPGTDFGLLAATAIDALRWGLPDRLQVRVASILCESRNWLIGSTPATTMDDGDLLAVATVYVRAMCPVPQKPAAIDLLDIRPLYAERVRQRRRHPIRALRRPVRPPVLAPATWQQSLWWRRAQETDDAVALVHAAAGIAAAVWSKLGPASDPIGIRNELRNRVVTARAWAASGELSG